MVVGDCLLMSVQGFYLSVQTVNGNNPWLLEGSVQTEGFWCGRNKEFSHANTSPSRELGPPEHVSGVVTHACNPSTLDLVVG